MPLSELGEAEATAAAHFIRDSDDDVRDVWSSTLQSRREEDHSWPSTACSTPSAATGALPEPLSCARAQLAALHAAVGKEEHAYASSSAHFGLGLLLQRATSLLETRYHTKTLPLYGTKHQADPPPASAGHADTVAEVEAVCLALRHEEMAAAGYEILSRGDPPVDEASRHHL